MTVGLSIRAIAEAEAVKGKTFGPCLLDDRGEWTFGGWDGQGWFDDQGLPIEPTVFALLPSLGLALG